MKTLFSKNISRLLLKNFFVRVGAMSRRGFLLIELLVALTLFCIIIVIAVGSFVTVLRTQRQVAALSAAESNLSLALEQMTREIRTGYLFCVDASGSIDPACLCVSSPTGETCSNIRFTNADGENVEYSLQGGVLEKSVNGGAAQGITGNNITVQYLNVILFGDTPGDTWNPRITIAIGIHPNESSLLGNVLNLETTASARRIDCTQGNPPQC